ncbi:MAG: PEPxxWA-CTERM sorting domain-containing protein [Proteobacteria bacterium]|nr:PEPxxWA-CTERM sorting domain-containing protein [Pseudomonadota bacterium]
MLETWDIFAGGYGQNFNYHPDLGVGPPIFTAADNLDFFGAFTISHELFDNTKGVAVYDYQTTGNWTADSVTITTFESGGVPEPAAWALMILGFGASGAALRRRRSAAIVA